MRGSTTRTLILTERVPRVVRLSPADVAFLLENHRTHLAIAPTGRRDVYRLTPRGHVGVLPAPTCRLVLRPKIPLDNLFFLLDPTAPVAAAADHTAPGHGDEVLDFLAGQFACRLAGRLAAGLHRGYREHQAQGPVLHGRLDLPAQVRQDPARKDQLHCRYDDFTADVPCNQALRATVERLLSSPLSGDGVRALLRQALGGLEGIQAIMPPPEVWQQLRAARLPEGYPLLLDLCGLLLEGLAPAEAAGPTAAPAFLIDMERVWERHVTRAALDAFARSEVVAIQTSRCVAQDAQGRPVLMRPDVTIERDGRTLLVLDAKWKRTMPVDDLYQVLAYAAALAAPRAALVCPGRRDRTREYTFEHTAMGVAVHTLRVEGTRDVLTRSARLLGRALCGGN
jgi:5-methylcytosine-specific restriction enzyme subunit McrC